MKGNEHANKVLESLYPLNSQLKLSNTNLFNRLQAVMGDVVAQWLVRRTWDLKVRELEPWPVHPCCALGTKHLTLTVALFTLGPVARSMVSANHWLSSIKINTLSWYLTLVSANQASSNSAQVYKWEPANCFGDNLTKC